MRNDSGSALGGALQPPQLNEPLIDRPALVRRLDDATNGTLTVLVAPGGWGKSTLAAQWAAHHLGAVAWLVFEPRHSSAAVATLLASAVAALGPGSSTAVAAPAFTPEFQRSLLEDLERLGPAYLVLEGVDHLEPEVRDDLGRLIEAAPSHVHFLVTTRADVLFPATIARLAMRDDVVFVRATDLAFDRDEARHVLEDVIDRTLDPGTVERALARTEGWPGALRILANSLRNTTDAVGTIDDFSGEALPLRAYFDAELLTALPLPVRTFVMETSVPDRVTVDLCRSLTDREDCSATLDLLGRYGLVERDAQGEWWQYPPLVREALVSELRESNPASEPHLLRIAAGWHADRGLLDDLDAAARYALRAEDWEFVHLLARRNSRRMHEAARLNTVLEWIVGVPEPVRRADAAFGMLEATVLTLTGHSLRAEQVLRTIEEAHRLGPGRALAAAAMRSVWVEDHLSPSLALAAADDALERARTLPPEDFRSVGDIVTPQNVATVAAVTRARARWYLGEISPARHDLFEHLEAGDTSPLSRLHLFGGLALVESWNGVLTLAEHFGAQAHEIANQSLVAGHPYLAPTELALAHVALEQGDTVVAAARLDAAARLMEIVSHSTWTTMLALERAWLALVEGRPREGIAVLAADTTESPFRPLFDGRRRALRARLLLALDDVAAAERALAYDPATANSAVAAVAAQLALTRGHQALARRVVDQWPRERSEQDHLAHCFWVAVVALAVGQEGVALSAAAEAVEVGAAGGHVRAFLDAGAVATPLLQLLGRHDATGHMAAVLAAGGGGRSSVADDTGDSLLTPRERVVLRHLADRLTYAEIADELFISRNTVKTHAKSVYMKLGANGRRDAIQRAEQHGLL